jgi:hypothetical protein
VIVVARITILPNQQPRSKKSSIILWETPRKMPKVTTVIVKVKIRAAVAVAVAVPVPPVLVVPRRMYHSHRWFVGIYRNRKTIIKRNTI